MKKLLSLSLLVAAVTLAAALPALANSDLIISEYIEGSSNNKALEIWNHTGAAIDLGAGGYKILMYFNGSATVGATINLVGTVANNDVFVLVNSGAGPALLALADQTSAASFYNGDDAVVLVKGVGNTVVDAIGQIGFDPGAEWGTGLVSTADNTLRRKSSVCDGDTNATNVFDPSVEWDGYALDTFDGIGSHSDGCGPTPAVPGTWGGLKAIYR
jgi:hypothetical protein